MSRKITQISFSKIPKLEYPELVNTIVRIVEEYDANIYFLNDTTVALKSLLPQLNLLKVTQRKHPESSIIRGLYKKRRGVLAGMFKQTKALVKANLTSQTEQVKVINPIVVKYWENLNVFNEKLINARVKLMIDDIDSTAEIKSAMNAVGLLLYVDELRIIETSLFESTERRRKSESTDAKVDSQLILAKLAEALSDLFNAIEFASRTHVELDYTSLINELNTVLDSYQASIKAHSTRLKNASDSATAADTTSTSAA